MDSAMKLASDFKDLLRSFDAECVEYAIVGGYAVAYHGYARFTKDLDILVVPTEENAKRVLKALESFGFGGVGLRIEDFSQPDQIVQLGRPPLRIDLITSLTGVDAAEVVAHRVRDPSEDLDLWFINKADLVRNKSASRRPQDLADLEHLRE